MEKRRDNKNRILKTGESQRTDGRYAYKYTDAFGNVQFVYAWKLVPTDRTPAFVVNIYNNENEEMFSEDDYGQEIDDMLITENDDMTDNDLEVVLGCKVFLKSGEGNTKIYKYEYMNGIIPEMVKPLVGHRIGDSVIIDEKEYIIENIWL